MLSLSGCKDAVQATFGGKITHKGQPVSAGVIYFLGPEPARQLGMGTIMNGTYTATDVPVGRVRVSFQVAGLPEKYSDPNRSTLEFDVTANTRNLDIDIP